MKVSIDVCTTPATPSDQLQALLTAVAERLGWVKGVQLPLYGEQEDGSGDDFVMLDAFRCGAHEHRATIAVEASYHLGSQRTDAFAHQAIEDVVRAHLGLLRSEGVPVFRPDDTGAVKVVARLPIDNINLTFVD